MLKKKILKLFIVVLVIIVNIFIIVILVINTKSNIQGINIDDNTIEIDEQPVNNTNILNEENTSNVIKYDTSIITKILLIIIGFILIMLSFIILIKSKEVD